MDNMHLRNQMVESQVRTNDVTDVRLQDGMRAVAREDFVTDARKSFAYADMVVDSPSGRTLWTARDFSKLAQAAEIHPNQSVTVVGGANFYAAAVFAFMGAKVTVVDPDATGEAPNGVTLDKRAMDQLADESADIVFIDGSVAVVPENWLKALKPDGRLAVVETSGASMGKANIYRRGAQGYGTKFCFDAAVPALAGFEAVAAFAF